MSYGFYDQRSNWIPQREPYRQIEGEPDLLTAARNAIPALELLGDYIGNRFDGKAGIPAFDRCQIILDLKNAIRADGERRDPLAMRGL